MAAAPAAASKGPLEGSAFDVGSTHLRLDLEGEAAKRLLAGKPGQGVRVVKAPSGAAMQLKLALPLSEYDLTDEVKEALVQAVIAACGDGVEVKVEEVANKPREFKGGGDPPLPKHTTTHPRCSILPQPTRPEWLCFP